MKGLLLKDAYQIWHYAKGVIVAAVVMMGAGVVTIMNGANFFIVYAAYPNLQAVFQTVKIPTTRR